MIHEDTDGYITTRRAGDVLLSGKATLIAGLVILLFGAALGDGAGSLLRAWWAKAPPAPIVGRSWVGPALPGNLVVQNGSVLSGAGASMGTYSSAAIMPVYSGASQVWGNGMATLVGGSSYSTTSVMPVYSGAAEIWLTAHGWSNRACVKCGQTPPQWDCHDVEIFDSNHNTVFRGCRTCLLAQIAGQGSQ